jgi:hypothetical protein
VRWPLLRPRPVPPVAVGPLDPAEAAGSLAWFTRRRAPAGRVPCPGGLPAQAGQPNWTKRGDLPYLLDYSVAPSGAGRAAEADTAASRSSPNERTCLLHILKIFLPKQLSRTGSRGWASDAMSYMASTPAGASSIRPSCSRLHRRKRPRPGLTPSRRLPSWRRSCPAFSHLLKQPLAG